MTPGRKEEGEVKAAEEGRLEERGGKPGGGGGGGGG